VAQWRDDGSLRLRVITAAIGLTDTIPAANALQIWCYLLIAQTASGIIGFSPGR